MDEKLSQEAKFLCAFSAYVGKAREYPRPMTSRHAQTIRHQMESCHKNKASYSKQAQKCKNLQVE